MLFWYVRREAIAKRYPLLRPGKPVVPAGYRDQVEAYSKRLPRATVAIGVGEIFVADRRVVCVRGPELFHAPGINNVADAETWKGPVGEICRRLI